MSDSVRTAFNRLEDASQQHETGIVVDLGVDRFIQWVGVYLLLAIAVIVRLAEAIGTSITCYPEDPLQKANRQLISYATAFCWEAWTGGNFTPTNLTHSVNLIKGKTWLMYFITNLPYMMLFQAFFFSIPWMLWHFAYGSRLTGHLKFVQLLLADIFKELQENIDYVFCTAEDSYDEGSRYLEGSWVMDLSDGTKNKKRQRNQSTAQAVVQPSELTTANRSGNGGRRTHDAHSTTSVTKVNETTPLICLAQGSHSNPDQTQETTFASSTSNQSRGQVGVADEPSGNSPNQNNAGVPEAREGEQGNAGAAIAREKEEGNAGDPIAKEKKQGNAGAPTARIEEQGNRNSNAASSGGSNQQADQDSTDRRFTIQGEMEDRHLFSMLCFENFASLHHLPYILSMFKLTRAPKKDHGNGTFVLRLDGILKIWSNQKNFSGAVIVRRYIWKQIGTGFFALLSLGIMVFWIVEVGPDLFSGSVTFRCELPSSDICMLCTFLRTRDFLAVLIVDVILTISLMAISFGHWLFVRGSSDKARCKFFVHMSNISNVALQLVQDKKEEKQKKES